MFVACNKVYEALVFHTAAFTTLNVARRYPQHRPLIVSLPKLVYCKTTTHGPRLASSPKRMIQLHFFSMYSYLFKSLIRFHLRRTRHPLHRPLYVEGSRLVVLNSAQCRFLEGSDCGATVVACDLRRGFPFFRHIDAPCLCRHHPDRLLYVRFVFFYGSRWLPPLRRKLPLLP